MKQLRRVLTPIISGVFLFAVFAAVSGCSSDVDLEKQFSGKWQQDGGTDIVDINLSANGPSLTLDGHVYPATIEKVDQMTNTVKLKVNTNTGNTETWSLHQVWNDNGSSFKVTLMRNGASETLVPVKQS